MNFPTRFIGGALLSGSVNGLLLSVLAVSLHSPAAAAEHELEPQRIVHFGDLDLTQDAGVEMLYGRIRAAARQVCAPIDERQLYQIESSQRCAREAIERAVTDVNAPALSSYEQSKHGHAKPDVAP